MRYFRGLTQICVVVGVFLSMISCFSTQAPMGNMPTDEITYVIFVPGYKGSLLKDRVTEETVWLNLEEIVFGSNSLALNTLNYSSNPELDLEPAGILDEIAILPRLFSFDIYSECLKQVSSVLPVNHRLITFPYDWRKGADFNGMKLVEFINELRSKSSSPIKIIAHSMGGLLSTYAIRSKEIDSNPSEQLVDSVAYLGTSFYGVLASFKDMQYEVPPILYNDDLLNRMSFSSFESAFDLMPPSFMTTFHSELNLTNKDIMYDIEKWDKYNWGLFGFRDKDTFESGRIKDYIKANLTRAEHVHSVIHADVSEDSSLSHMKILNVVASGYPTLATGDFDPKEPIGLAFHSQRLRSDGDGVVTKESASLPASFGVIKNVKVKEVVAEHRSLCLNEGVLEELRLFFR